MKRKHITILFILSILTAFSSAGAFLFLFHVIENKNTHTEAVLTVLDKKSKEKEDTVGLAKKVAGVEAVRSQVEVHFVDPKKINLFVDYLEGFGARTGTEVAVTDVQASTADTNSILVKISIKGTLDGIVKMIALLENDKYQIHITASYINSIAVALPAGPQDSKQVVPTDPKWQADISFAVLSATQ